MSAIPAFSQTERTGEFELYDLDEKTAAKICAISPQAMKGWRLRGLGPRFKRIAGSTIRYRRSDIIAWIEQQPGGGAAA